MSRSFNKKIEERLGDYQPIPPSGAKRRLFKRMAGQEATGFTGWQVAGIVLLVISFLQITPKQGLDTSGASVSGEISPAKPTRENRNEENAPETKSESLPITSRDQDDRKEIDQTREIIIFDETGVNEKTGPTANQKPQPDNYFSWDTIADPDPIGYQISAKESYDLPSLSPDRKAKKPLVDKKKKFFRWYGDAGVFFIYRQGRPNASDDLIIEDYQGPGRFSAERLGWILEGGVYRDLNEKIRLKAGISLSTFQQQYTFSLRNTAPDSVISIDESITPSFEAVFDRQQIHMAHRLWVLGGSLGADFFIFPSKNNSLYTHLEYQLNIRSRRSIRFDGEKYHVYYPNQIMWSFGLRKKVFEHQRANFYLIPNFRYALSGFTYQENDILTLKPFSAGITFSVQFD